jgi:hypothetical protein
LTAAARASEVPGFAGLTRPGNPADSVLADKVVPAALDDETRRSAVGGTVYFLVLQRDEAKAADPWGTGLKEFAKTFRAGIDFGGDASPALDMSAKYLYLYQVVNDRHTPVPIQSTGVKLIVELKDISSWGYFSGIGFATEKKEDAKAVTKIRPVSFSNILAPNDADLAYQLQAPPVLLPKGLHLAHVPIRQGEAAPAVKDAGLVQVHWDALDPAHNPDNVMLLKQSDFKDRPSFRAIWNGKNAIPKDSRSTVFGFTSNLPPTIEPVRLRGLFRDEKGKEIRPAAVEPAEEADPEARSEIAAASGKVPTPKPESPATSFTPPLASGGAPPAAPPPPPPPILPPFGGGVPTGGGGSSAPPPALVSGGGGTTSGTTGTAQQQQQQQPRHASRQSLTQTLTNLINITVNQSQSQQQQQQQGQHQGQHQHSHGVVPHPSALVLAALGLPFLLWLRRRERRDLATCRALV